MMEPSTTPIAHLSIPPLPINVPPIRSEANAIVTIPVPISILTDFCDCARRHPASPVNALATQSPTIVVNTGLIEDERTISGLLPVALMASPSLVFKNKVIMATALNEEKNVKMAFELGCTIYSGKPIDQDRFEHALKKLGLIE